MRHVKEFIIDSGGLGVASELAALVAFLIGLWEHTEGKTVPGFIFVGISVLLFWVGAYIAWNRKRVELETFKTKLDDEIANRALPRLVVSLTPIGDHQYCFRLHNGSSAPAVGIRFDDVISANAALEFRAPASLGGDKAETVYCQTKNSGYKVVNDLSALFPEDSEIEVLNGTPPVEVPVRIWFSSADTAKKQRHWCLRTILRFDYFKEELTLLNQTIDEILWKLGS